MLSDETENRPAPNTRENEDPAKMTYSIMDFAGLLCLVLAEEARYRTSVPRGSRYADVAVS